MNAKFPIRRKITILTAISSILLMLAILIASFIVNKQNVLELSENYMYDIAISASDTLYESFYGDSERDDISTRLEYILDNIKVATMDSSYCYLLDTDGTYLYHPDSDKIGTTMSGNDEIQAVLDRLNSEGVITTADVQECQVDGKDVYISFICTVNNWVLVVQADQSDVMAPVYKIAMISGVIGVILLVVFLAIVICVTNRITRPLTKITGVIDEISDLKVNSDTEIPQTDDEIGLMANSVSKMRHSLRKIVEDISGISGVLVDDSNSLYDISEQVNAASTDNSTTNQRLAASMEETSQSTEEVNASIQSMNESIADMVDQIQKGTELTDEVKQKSQQIKENAKAASDETISMYGKIREDSELAIDKAKEVDKINSLATAIQDIAEETNLLSLNASIEAARAGEAGKGFAVVADEISKLANQSQDTSEDIMAIAESVNESVKTLTDNLIKILDFMEQNVMADYNGFLDSSTEYSQAATEIGSFMAEVLKLVSGIKVDVQKVASSVDGISGNINECSDGVNDIAEKTNDVVDLTAETFEKTSNCKDSANKLLEITSRFN